MESDGEMDMSDPVTRQRFNHVAISLPADALDDDGRAAIIDFYEDVFGWVELPTMTLDRERLVLSAHRADQFVFLIADEEPMTAPQLDHFGLAVDSLADLETLYARARTRADASDAVEIREQTVEDHGVVKLHNFYVRYRLPLMVEVQYFEWSS